MQQLSFLTLLETPKARPGNGRSSHSEVSQAMSAPHRPTSAQINYLKKLTRIKKDSQLARYVARKVGKGTTSDGALILTKKDFATVIDQELTEKRWSI